MRTGCLGLVLFVGLTTSANAESQRSGWVGFSLGQHFTGKLNPMGIHPMLEFRGGTPLAKALSLEMHLGGGATRISHSNQASFVGAGFLIGHLSLLVAYTKALSKNLELILGGTSGAWFSALWGDDLTGTRSGTVHNYLEQLSVSWGAVIGLDWALNDSWALSLLSRWNLAFGDFAGEVYNTGGLSLLFGVVYRLAPDKPQPALHLVKSAL